MKKFLSLAILGASIVAAPMAHASTLNASAGVSFFGNTNNPNSQAVSTSGNLSSGTITYNLWFVTPSNFGNSTLTETSTITINLSDFSGFTITIPGIGTFTTTAAPVILLQTADQLNVYLLGTLVVNNGITDGTYDASFRIAGSQSGVTPSISATLSTPPAGLAPEPSSLILLGTGLVGGVGAMRRRLK